MIKTIAIGALALISISSFANTKNYKNECSTDLISTVQSMTDVVARVNRYYPNGIINARSEKDVSCALIFAKQNNIKISIKTGGFSQGGQWAINNGLILDLSTYKGFSVDKENKTVTAKAGTTWKEIQNKADKDGLAIRVMQSSNIFPIGGAIGINAHGRDISDGQIVNTVNWIKVAKANGDIVIADSESKNTELFKEVVGGLGLRGVILEANLNLRDNKIYETVVLSNIDDTQISEIFTLMRTTPHLLKKYVSAEDLSKISFNFDNLSPDKIGLGYGRAANLSVDSDDYLGKKLFYIFVEVPQGKINSEANLHIKDHESFTESTIMPLLMELQRNFEGAKTVREKLEKMFMRKTGQQASLNYLMNPPVNFLLYKLSQERDTLGQRLRNFGRRIIRFITGTPQKSTDILREYFIPNNTQSVNSFLDGLRNTVKEHDLDLLNITYRVVPKTPEAKQPYITYSKGEMIAFVLNFHIEDGPRRWEKTGVWTKKLVDYALNAGGVHYLAYEAHATYDQFIQAYPGAAVIFSKLLDDESMNIFMNEYMKVYYEEYINRL